jgi:hypothetical protein
MKQRTHLTLLFALIAGYTMAQQAASTSQRMPAQTQSSAASTVPCNKPNPTPPRKPGYLEKKAKALACKQNKQFCDLPSSQQQITGAMPDAKPCPASTTVNASAASANSKPILVCPPNSTLVPDFPYCLKPDHTTVDAIALPPSLSAPPPPVPAAPAPTQH